VNFLKIILHIYGYIFLVGSIGYSFEYNELQKPVFQFVDNGQYADQLIQTTELISFLAQTYEKAVRSDRVLTGFQNELQWDFNWSQNYLGAGSSLNHNKFTIMLYGGYVRAEGSSFELVAITLCHELGHYLGGEPKQIFNGVKDWSSSEGQADFFAVRECLPKVYQFFKNKKSYLKVSLNQEERNIVCAVPSLDIREQCLWSIGAGLEFAKFAHHYFDRDQQKPSLFRKAQEVPNSTLVSVYPTTQCRLDTYVHGSRCAAGESIFCNRPRCWYKP